jgi:hypothetical protein
MEDFGRRSFFKWLGAGVALAGATAALAEVSESKPKAKIQAGPSPHFMKIQPIPHLDVEDLPCGLYDTGNRKTEDWFDIRQYLVHKNARVAELIRIDTPIDPDGKKRELPSMPVAYWRKDGMRVVTAWELESNVRLWEKSKA